MIRKDGGRTFLARFPGEAEARYLAGILRRPATPATEAAEAIRAWLKHLAESGAQTVAVAEVVAELEPLAGKLAADGPAPGPACGPFAPDGRGLARPGRVEYAGDTVVRLDEVALGSLEALRWSEDFRVTWEDNVPVMLVGGERLVLVEERYPEGETGAG